jgi:hypothetical protein
MSLTVEQFTNVKGFPKAAELIEITGAHALEASDRAIFNQLLQIAHDSDKLVEPDAEWEITLSSLRRASSKHESNDRVRESLRRLRRTEVKVTYVSGKRISLSSRIPMRRNPATQRCNSGYQSGCALYLQNRTVGDVSAVRSPTQ